MSCDLAQNPETTCFEIRKLGLCSPELALSHVPLGTSFSWPSLVCSSGQCKQ